jgi:hypothetical protein
MSKITHNSAVTCKSCGAEITFASDLKLPPVIGAGCGKCGRRNIYTRDDARSINKAQDREASGTLNFMKNLFARPSSAD